MRGKLEDMEFMGDHGRSYFSGEGGAEPGFKCVDDHTGKREELKAVPEGKYFEMEQNNVTLFGEGCET